MDRSLLGRFGLQAWFDLLPWRKAGLVRRCAGGGLFLVLTLSLLGCASTSPSPSSSSSYGPPLAFDVTVEPTARPTETLWGGWYRSSGSDLGDPEPSVVAALAAARSLDARDEREAAICALTAAQERSPGAPELLEARGALYAAAGFRRAAAADFEKVVELAPGRGSAWLALARMRQALGLPGAAMAALEACRDLGLRGFPVDLLGARVERDLRHWHAAAVLYSRAVSSMSVPGLDLLVEVATLADERRCLEPEELARAATSAGLSDHETQILWETVRTCRDLEPTDVPGRLADAGIDPHRLARWSRVVLRALQPEAMGAVVAGRD